MPSLSETLSTAVRVLRDAGVDTPEVDARLLAAHALGMTRTDLLVQYQKELSATERERVAALVERRMQHEPVSRIVGRRDFWSLSLGLNNATLDPRADSETLIEVALALFPDRRAPLHILDLGTGTGCLLLALLSEFPHAAGVGADISVDAVTQASFNAKENGLTERARFTAWDWTDGSTLTALTANNFFDLVVSNPPYIRRGDIPSLMPDVRNYDPHAALDGGIDGLDAYRAIAKVLPCLLRPGGRVVLEVGYDQATSVTEILTHVGLRPSGTRYDLNGIERCVVV